jgi:hypothetical protein
MYRYPIFILKQEKEKSMKVRIFFLLFMLIIALCIKAPEVQSEWIDIPLENPGAETGDMSGWTPWGFSTPDPINYQAIYDPNTAHEGEYYFTPVSLNEIDQRNMLQHIDLSLYSGFLLNLEFGGHTNIVNNVQHRMGYDQETDAEYEYVFYSSVFVLFRGEIYSLFASFGTVYHGSDWQYQSVNTTQDWPNEMWKLNRKDVVQILVGFGYYYAAVDYENSPPYFEIEEWRDWIGDEPIVRHDSARLRIEVIDYLTKCDFDSDGDVDGFDLAEFSDRYTNNIFPDADLNEDGLIDTEDVGIFATIYGF